MGLLFKIIRGRLPLALAAIGAGGLWAAVTLWWNTQLAILINTISVGRAIPARTIFLVLATVLCMAAAAWLKGYLSGLACESMAHDLRMGYARHFAALPVEQVEGLNTGEQLSRLQNEVAAVCGYLGGSLFQLADDAISFAATLVYLLVLGPALTLAINLPVAGMLLYMAWSSRVISAAIGLSQQAMGGMNRQADTLLSLFPIIRLYDATRMVTQSYRAGVAEWETQTVRAERTKARLMSLSGVMQAIPLLLLLLLGGGMAIGGALSLGSLYVFINLSGNVSGVMMNMPGHIAAFRQFAANMKRIAPSIRLKAEEG